MIARLLCALAVLFFATSAEATARFMTNNGSTTGTCTTAGTACRWDRVVAVAACGDSVTMLNGTYQGANNMMNTVTTTPANPTCTLGNEITFSAETEGGVFIDGQFARLPVNLVSLTYWIFEGFDAGNSNLTVATIRNTTNSTFRRLCFSNAIDVNPNNEHVLLVWNSGSNVFEDICAFGTGRDMLITYDDGGGAQTSNNTFRRIWVRGEGWWEGILNVQASYFAPGRGNNLYENFICIYDPEQQSVVSGFMNGCVMQRQAASPIERFYGWIVYGYDGFTDATHALTDDWVRDVDANGGCAGCGAKRDYKDIFVDGRSQTTSSAGVRPFDFSCAGSATCASNLADRLTSIKSTMGAASDFFSGGSLSNQNECTSLSGCPNFYTGDSPGTGSRSCFRYVDGTLTSTPLWPWPMDDRIKAALARAAAAGTGGSALAGTAGSGYAANTVTSEIVSRYGSIPSACLAGSSFTPSFPVASDFPSVSVRDDFDRANASTLGSGWTELFSDTFSISSNAAAAPSTGGAFARALYSDTKLQTSHEVYATWPTVQTAGSSFLVFAAQDLTNNNQYRLVMRLDNPTNTTIEVISIDGAGSSTTVMAAVDLGTDVVDGNSFGVRVSGTTISIYWKWTDDIWYRIGEFTDSNLSSLPSTGVYGGIAGGSPAVINNFGAGPFVDQPVQAPPAPPASVGVGRFGTTFPGVR